MLSFLHSLIVTFCPLYFLGVSIFSLVKYPEKKKDGLNFVHLELNEHDYLLNLFQFMRSEKDEFIYMQNLFLKHLNLPYDATIVDNDDIDTANIEPINPNHLEFEKMWNDYFEQKATIVLKKLVKNTSKLGS